MALRVQNNVTALNTQRNLTHTDRLLSRTLERLSSGFRVNRAADDAANLAVSQGLRADLASYKVASRNTSEANSLLQVAEGAMDQIGNMLTRLKELATQAASANTSGSNRVKLNSEATQLANEISRIANVTNYAGTNVIDGTFTGASTVVAADLTTINAIDNVYDFDVSEAAGGNYTITYAALTDELTLTKDGVSQTLTLTAGATIDFTEFDISFKTTEAADVDTVGAGFGTTLGDLDVTAADGAIFQVGAGNSSNNQIRFSITDVDSDALGTTALAGGVGSIDITTAAGAQTAMDVVDEAIDDVALARGQIGAVQNRLTYAAANLATTIENVTAADSVIRDADMAAEMTEFTKHQILLQAGTAMLAQANAAPQVVLSLLS